MNLAYLRTFYYEPFKNLSSPKDDGIADRHLNISYLEVFRAFRWNARKRIGQVLLYPRYTTGTVTVTVFTGANLDAAKTITFDTALDSSYLGRYIKFSGGSKWYKIIYIDGVTAYLDVPVIETPTANTFEIWKRFYYVKSDAEKILDFGNWGNGVLNFNPDIISQDDISKTGTPSDFESYGIDPYDDVEYSTGTVTIEKDTNVAVGTGTEWLKQGFDTGDIMVIANVDYFIKRVESNTRIILQNYFEAKKTNEAHKLHKNNPIGFEFYNQSESYSVLPYSYYGRGYPLVHPTKDRIQLSDKFIPAIISRAQYYGFKSVEDLTKRAESLAVYQSELEGLKMKDEVVDARYNQFAPKIVSGMPGR